MSIRSTFDQELQDLRDNVLRLGSMVDTAIGRAVQALKARDQKLAQQVIVEDEEINFTTRSSVNSFRIWLRTPAR